MKNLVTDLRYGLRALMARPLLTLIAVASLALGIGVNTAIYSLYHQAVLRPLPVPASERLVDFQMTLDYPTSFVELLGSAFTRICAITLKPHDAKT
jgi:hypothetical protein